MAVSTNLGLYLPTREDYISVSRDLSNNYEIIDKSAGMLEKGSAIVVNGNTAPTEIIAGQYLLIKNHSTLASGSYHATANISNGATISNSNVEIDDSGLANAIKAEVDALNSKIAMKDVYLEQETAVSHNFTVENNSSNVMYLDGNGAGRLYAALIYKASGNITVKPYFENTNFTITVSGNTLTIASTDGSTSFPVYARIINIRGATIS